MAFTHSTYYFPGLHKTLVYLAQYVTDYNNNRPNDNDFRHHTLYTLDSS